MATPLAEAETAAPPANSTVIDDTIIPTIAEEAPVVAPPAISGFSFLTDSNAPPLAPLDGMEQQQLELPAAIHTRTSSYSSISSALSTPSLPSAPTSTPAVPTMTTGGGIAGAGVTFGTSSAKPRIKKKKIRSSKIGMGASHNDASSPAPPALAPAPAPAPVVPTPVPPEIEAKSTRDAALEATKKAETFMQSKAMETTRSSEATAAAASVTTERVEDLGLEPTMSTDEVLVAAKEAAEKAKILQHQQKGKNSGGFIGTFFKGFRPSHSAAGNDTTTNGSKHSVDPSPNANGSGMDRLAKEQKVAKQAIAERQRQRQLQQQQKPKKQQQQQHNDDEVVVSTSVGGYKPEVVKAATNIEPMKYTPTAPLGISQRSTTFSPAAIPSTLKPKPTPNFQPAVVPSYGEVKKSFAPPAAEPKKKMNNSPTDIFEEHQKYFSESVNSAMKKVEDARSLKKGLLEEHFVALAKDRFATREIEQIEELLQAAIDEEDYEEADELGQKLDELKREKNEVANVLTNNENALERLESEKSSLGEMVASCFQDLALRLDELKKKEVAGEKKDDVETLTQYGTISKQLSDEHERLQQDLKHLERDEQQIAEERNELEGSINEQTGEIETQREEASAKIKEAEDEIEELRKLLENKQNEVAKLRTKMFGFEDSISKVRVKFSRQLNRVNNKEMTVKQNRREWEIENKQYTKQKEAHDLQVQTHSNALLAHEALINKMEFELKLAREFSEIIPAQLGFMEENETEEKDSGDEGSLAQLKANVVKCEGAVDAAKNSLKMSTCTIQNLETERDGLIARIPDLEKQKKAAAAGRDFKAAGKFSKMIKEDTSRIQECDEELKGDAKAKRASAEETLRKLDFDLLEAKKIANAKEKLSGEKRMVTLAKKIEQLMNEKKERCGDEASAGNSVKSVCARVLEGQIMMLRVEGKELGSKYGGWDDLVNSMDSEGVDSSSGVDLNDSRIEDPVKEAPENIDIGLTTEEIQERLAKAKGLISKCAELEEKIQKAADVDDFEAAGKLQEELDKVNSEIEEMNITDEECELLAQEEIPIDTIPTAKEEEEEECGLTTEERVAKARQLMTKQSDLEEKVEEAAEREDFEAAEEFQTRLDQINSELEELNITDEEKDVLTKEEETSPTDAPLAPEDKNLEVTISDAVEEEEEEEEEEDQENVESDERESQVEAEKIEDHDCEDDEECESVIKEQHDVVEDTAKPSDQDDRTVDSNEA